MNKKTLSAILTGIIVILSITIVILVVKIVMRGPKKNDDLASNKDNIIASEDYAQANDVSANEAETNVVPELVARPDKSSTSVNVRSGPGTDYERIGSAYPDCEYIVLEVLNNGWTKMEYDGEDAYISSEYLSYEYRLTLGDGTYSYSEAGNVSGYIAPNEESTTIDTTVSSNNAEDADNPEAGEGADEADAQEAEAADNVETTDNTDGTAEQ